jgi:hypothetical protein
MKEFSKVHKNCITGVLHGFDRVVFRGTLRSVSHTDGLGMYMNSQKVLLKDFDVWAQRCTRRISGQVEAAVKAAGRPVVYVPSAAINKEQRALTLAQEDGITQGLICALSCVEPCVSPEIHRNAQRQRLELKFVPRKCKFYYLYLIDPVFGWMSIRLQSWIPFDVQVCLNGRSYLQGRLDQAGISYVKADNCFTRIDDLEKAQGFMDELVDLNWPQVLRRLLAPYWPVPEAGLLPEGPERYYWSIRQSEVATDVMFRDAASLAAIYPRLCRHGIDGLGCQDVLRFFDRKSFSRGGGQVASTYLKLVQGTRLKHRLGSNWIKMYDKAGSVLRIETTINDPRRLRVFRGTLEEPDRDLQWRPMAKAVADIQRRAAFCRQANERYLEALAPVGRPVATAAVLDAVAAPVVRGEQRCRGLRPVSPDDALLLAAVMEGQHLIDGITNGGLQAALFAGAPVDPPEARRRSNAVGRKLRLLRQHGLIQKVGARRLYRATAKGRQVIALTMAVRQSTNMLAIAA